ncbi:MAG: caspase family protein [Paludibacteraceae bacterium]|nr:caspase family protein [Paludibacteraceae bacterium]
MKKRIVLILVWIGALFPTMAHKYALVIGIGNYPDVDYGWCTINGNNDIAIVQEMLLANGFKSNHIFTLCDANATYNHILDNLAALTNKLQQGDRVYIHFSGHGQQITDLDGDEKDGYDEAWIPYDALQEPTSYYHGEKHLTDDIINKQLHLMRQKVGAAGSIVVVIDACHSGTATRDISDSSIVRGSTAKFTLSAKPLPFTQERPIEWISIAACSDDEVNRQCRVEGNHYGSLSYVLYTLRHQLSNLTLSALTAKLAQQVTYPLVARPQTPTVEYSGSNQQLVFP